MQLGKPTAGWIRWKFLCKPESFYINISNIFNSLEDIWFWALDLAHGFLPQTHFINEEGSYMQLVASSDQNRATGLKLTVSCLDEERQQVYFEHEWFLDRVRFLEAMGELFGAYFRTDFDAREWANGRGHTDLAGLLPWDFPASVARASIELDALAPAQVEWALACRLDPDLHPVFKRMGNEDRLKLFFQLTLLRRSLACLAWRGDQNIRWYEKAFPANIHYELYQLDYEQAKDLFEELEMMREGHPDYAWLAEPELRERVVGECADKLLDWDRQLIQATEPLLPATEHGPGLALCPGWEAVYGQLQMVESIERVLLHSPPQSEPGEEN